MKRERIYLVAGILIVLVAAASVYTYTRSRDPFPPPGIACVEAFQAAVTSGYSDFSYPEFSYDRISYFRCASNATHTQYEVRGIDAIGHSFYVHKSEGGRAASGADSYADTCFMIDGIIQVSHRYVGRDGVRENGTCYWTDGFPENPTSEYEYAP